MLKPTSDIVIDRDRLWQLAAEHRWISDAIREKLDRDMPQEVTPPAAPYAPEAPTWPLSPTLRQPRFVTATVAPTRSVGEDSSGAYYEDFYPPGSEQPVYRDDQGYFIIEDGKEYITYLNPPGAGIEHRIMPRPEF